MAGLTFELEVTYTDDRTETVVADQRDMAAWELDPVMGNFGGCLHAVTREGRPTLAFRWLAWHALVREKRTKLGWVKWGDEALSVEFAPVSPPGAEDPGEPTAPDEPKSE